MGRCRFFWIITANDHRRLGLVYRVREWVVEQGRARCVRQVGKASTLAAARELVPILGARGPLRRPGFARHVLEYWTDP